MHKNFHLCESTSPLCSALSYSITQDYNKASKFVDIRDKSWNSSHALNSSVNHCKHHFSIQPVDSVLVETSIRTSTDRWAAYLPSLWAAPPSVTVLTKIPSFSRPMSAPAPMPMILIPRPSLSEPRRDKNTATQYRYILFYFFLLFISTWYQLKR